MKKHHIVLDIDMVLALHDGREAKYASFFLKKGAIFQAIKTHYIFPGVIEFLQLLFQDKDLKVSFFSSGIKRRNDIFVENLLRLALGEDRYETVKKDVLILSRNDLISIGEEEEEKEHALYGRRPGNNQKDLLKVLQEGELLENVILIDDDPSYAACGQVKNMLYVPPTMNYDFCSMEKEIEGYDENGFKNLKWEVLSIQEYNGYERNQVGSGKRIVFLQKEEGLEVAFIDKDSHEYVQKPLSEKQSQELNAFLSSSQKEDSYIYDLVTSLGGQAKKIRRGANRIYYAVGLLFTALERAKNEGNSVADVLFSLQFKKNIIRSGNAHTDREYEPIYYYMTRRDHFYLLGLEKLRQVNSNLELMHPKKYVECINSPLTEEEKAFLQDALDKER